MDILEEIWEKGNDQVSNDETFDSEFIKKSISETSISITSKLPKIIRFGLVVSCLAAAMFVYNIFFYLGNISILISIITLLLLTSYLFTYLLSQLKIIRKLDSLDLNLQSLLMTKIKYLNTRFQIALHCVSLSIVLATFTINLTIENSDGVFEFRKIMILSIFYFFAYVISLLLYKTMYGVYIKQLSNALVNLTENKLKSFEKELKRHKRIRKIIGVIVILVFLLGILFLFLKM